MDPAVPKTSSHCLGCLRQCQAAEMIRKGAFWGKEGEPGVGMNFSVAKHQSSRGCVRPGMITWDLPTRLVIELADLAAN